MWILKYYDNIFISTNLSNIENFHNSHNKVHIILNEIDVLAYTIMLQNYYRFIKSSCNFRVLWTNERYFILNKIKVSMNKITLYS